MGLTSVKIMYVEKTSTMTRMELIKQKAMWLQGQGFDFGTWHIRTPFETGAVISLCSPS